MDKHYTKPLHTPQHAVLMDNYYTKPLAIYQDQAMLMDNYYIK